MLTSGLFPAFLERKADRENLRENRVGAGESRGSGLC